MFHEPSKSIVYQAEINTDKAITNTGESKMRRDEGRYLTLPIFFALKCDAKANHFDKSLQKM